MSNASSKPTFPRGLKPVLYGFLGCVFFLFVFISGTSILLRIDPSKVEPVLETIVSHLLEREFQIGNLAEVDLGMDTYLLAHDLTLANADWATEPHLASVGRLSVHFNLPSIWRKGPIIIDRLKMTNVSITLQAPANQLPNWVLVADDNIEQIDSDELKSLTPVLISQGLVLDGEIHYQDPDQSLVAVIKTLEIEDSAPDALIAMNAVATVNNIPLSMEGHMGPMGALLTQTDLKLDLTATWGKLSIEARGMIGNVADLSGAELQLKITTPESRPLLDALGLQEIRDGPLVIEGSVSDGEPGVIFNLDGTLDEFNLHLSGQIDNPKEADGVDLKFVFNGPSLSEFATAFELNGLPDFPFRGTGEVRRHGTVLNIRHGSFKAGEGQLSIDGFLPNFPTIDDWRVSFVGDSIDFSPISRSVGIDELPAALYDIQGELKSTDDGIELISLLLSNPLSALELKGVVGQGPQYYGSSLDVIFTGRDLSLTGLNVGFPNLPSEAFTLNALLSYSETGWRLKGGKFFIPEVQIELDGEIDQLADKAGLMLNFQITSPDLSRALKSFNAELDLPKSFPLRLSGQLTGSTDNLSITNAVFKSGESIVTVSGVIGDPADMKDFDMKDFGMKDLDLTLGLRSPDLLTFLPPLFDNLQPILPLDITGRIQTPSQVIKISGLAGQFGGAEINLSGQLNLSGNHDGSYFNLDGSSADSGKLFSPWLEWKIPEAPVNLSIAVKAQSGGLEIDILRARIDDHQLTGKVKLNDLNNPHTLNGDIRFAGASSKDLVNLLDIDVGLPDANYLLKIRMEGSTESLSLDPITLDWGRSDYRGSVKIQLDDPPIIKADLSSSFVDLSYLLPDMQKLEQEEAARIAAGNTFDESTLDKELTTQELKERLIPNTPLKFSWIRNLQLDFRYEADKVYFNDEASAGAIIDFTVNDGVLKSRNLVWDGPSTAGEIELTIRARETDTEIDTYIDMRRLPLMLLMGGTINYEQPSFYRARVNTTGDNFRELLQNANGIIAFKGGGGSMNNHGVELFLGDTLEAMISRLNPNRKNESETVYLCHAGAMSLNNGILELSPGLVLRSDKLDIASAGKVNLYTEKLNVVFNTRSRTGIGLSASKAITPYFKIGGTLAHPRLVIDTKGAVVSGSAAAATAGLSIVAGSLWDRWVATAKNPCERLHTNASKKHLETFQSILD